jgi:hypothetical protein
LFPKVAVDPEKIVCLDLIVQDAVALKYTATPLPTPPRPCTISPTDS